MLCSQNKTIISYFVTPSISKAWRGPIPSAFPYPKHGALFFYQKGPSPFSLTILHFDLSQGWHTPLFLFQHLHTRGEVFWLLTGKLPKCPLRHLDPRPLFFILHVVY